MGETSLLGNGGAKLKGIKARTLKAIMEAAKETYPEEFSALLRMNPKTGAINEFVMLPGTISGRRSAQMGLHMMPVDYNVIGSVHSHPSGSCLPSDEDLFFFEKFGGIHIIVCMPYSDKSWICYRHSGEEYPLEVLQ